jgi:hypothetical protein
LVEQPGELPNLADMDHDADYRREQQQPEEPRGKNRPPGGKGRDWKFVFRGAMDEMLLFHVPQRPLPR